MNGSNILGKLNFSFLKFRFTSYFSFKRLSSAMKEALVELGTMSVSDLEMVYPDANIMREIKKQFPNSEYQKFLSACKETSLLCSLEICEDDEWSITQSAEISASSTSWSMLGESVDGGHHAVKKSQEMPKVENDLHHSLANVSLNSKLSAARNTSNEGNAVADDSKKRAGLIDGENCITPA